MVDTRLQCAEKNGSNRKMTGIDDTQRSLAMKYTGELKGMWH